MRSRRRRIVVRFLLYACALVAAGFLFEFLCSVLAYVQYGTLDVAHLNSIDVGNVFVAERQEGYAATLQPHPYLGMVNNSKVYRVNDVGTACTDFPLKRDPSKFTILLTGGSVANQVVDTGQSQWLLQSTTSEERSSF